MCGVLNNIGNVCDLLVKVLPYTNSQTKYSLARLAEKAVKHGAHLKKRPISPNGMICRWSLPNPQKVGIGGKSSNQAYLTSVSHAAIENILSLSYWVGQLDYSWDSAANMEVRSQGDNTATPNES